MRLSLSFTGFGSILEDLPAVLAAEECGFDSVFVSDHLQPWRHDGGHAPFAMSWLGALGASTQRITMGTSVLTPTFRYHPAIVAQAFATLGCLYPGRVVLGMGSGESMNEVPLGIEWPDGKERFGRFREAVRLIRELWAGERLCAEAEGLFISIKPGQFADLKEERDRRQAAREVDPG